MEAKENVSNWKVEKANRYLLSQEKVGSGDVKITRLCDNRAPLRTLNRQKVPSTPVLITYSELTL